MRASFRFCWISALIVAACGDDAEPPMPMEDAGSQCESNAQCDDGLFCNGEESCDPEDDSADEMGCVSSDPPCADLCSEAMAACVSECPDADADGHDEQSCGGDDCDDTDDDRYPGNTERCDSEGHDEDCDPDTWGPDADGDGFVGTDCCAMGEDGLTCGTDCDDDSAEVNEEASEICNGTDEDCDESIDEGVLVTYYPDTDGDGFGDAAGAVMMACSQPGRYVEDATDCDDTSAARNPSLAELCDGIDNDCDGELDGPDEDDDDDGFADSCAGLPAEMTDCDDTDPDVNPGAAEICDGIDNDCDGTGDDGDGDMQAATDDPCEGGPYPKTDCDDASADVYAGAPELCNGTDNDCSGAADDPSPICNLDNAAAMCVTGGCIIDMCSGTYRDCDTEDSTGCEIDTASDERHCGMCDNACGPAEYCRMSSCTEATSWAVAPNRTRLYGVAPDGSGGAFVVGSLLSETLDLGVTTLTNTGPCSAGSCPEDVVVIHVDSMGVPVWGVSFGGTSDDVGYDVAVDPSGNVLVGSRFYSGDLTIGGGSPIFSRGGRDILVTKLDGATGSHEWTVRYGASNDDVLLSIDSDDSGDVFIGGQYESSVLSIGTGLVNQGASDIFVAKLDGEDGSPVWAKTYGGLGNNMLGGVAHDGSGGVYVVGTWETMTLAIEETTLTISSCNLPPPYCQDDIFIAKLDGEGDLDWATQLETPYEDILYSMGVVSGDVVVVGRFTGALAGEDFDVNGDHGIVRVSATDGSALWAFAVDFDLRAQPSLVAGDSQDRVVFAGWLGGPMATIGDREFTNTGPCNPTAPEFCASEMLVGRLDSSGELSWVTMVPNMDGDESPVGLAVDSADRIFVAGTFSGATYTIGSETLVGDAASSTHYAFVASFQVD